MECDGRGLTIASVSQVTGRSYPEQDRELHDGASRFCRRLGSYVCRCASPRRFPNSLVGEAVQTAKSGSAQRARPISALDAMDEDIAVRIRGLMMDPVTNMPIDRAEGRGRATAVLPIWVGIYEANAIALELEKTATPRPMTHDLLRECTDAASASCT